MLTRTFAASSLLVVSLVFAQSDLHACGDKSLSAGGIRIQRALAARHPAAILIYSPAGSKMQGAAHELNLQDTLLKVGHTYRQVTTTTELDAALVTGKFNIVLADLADLSQLQQKLGPSGPAALVAVAHHLSKPEVKAATKASRFLIKAPGSAVDYLYTIADAVRSRSNPRKA